MQDWFYLPGDPYLAVVCSTVGVFVGLIVLVRLVGLRSFSKMSSFDFAMTIAVGSMLASAAILKTAPLARVFVALITLFTLQLGIATLRKKSRWARRLVDNSPLLLMKEGEFLEANMRAANVTRDDMLAKLREANVRDLDDVLAVVFETTGDISVLHSSGEASLSPALLSDVERG